MAYKTDPAQVSEQDGAGNAPEEAALDVSLRGHVALKDELKDEEVVHRQHVPQN